MVSILLRRSGIGPTSVLALAVAACLAGTSLGQGALPGGQPRTADQQQQAKNQQQKKGSQTTSQTPVVPPGTRGFKATMTQEAILQQQEAAKQHKAVVAPGAHKTSAAQQAGQGTAAQTAARVVVSPSHWWEWSPKATPSSSAQGQNAPPIQIKVVVPAAPQASSAARKSR